MAAECAAMGKEQPPIGYIEHLETTPENGAKDVLRLLKENFYFPQRVREMPTIQEIIATADDRYTYMVPKEGYGSSERVTSTKLCDPGLQCLQEESGFRITGMRNDSSALFSEIVRGDLIVHANGRPVNNNDMRVSTT